MIYIATLADAVARFTLFRRSRGQHRNMTTQPRLNDLVRGRIDKFSLDALMNLAARAGLSILKIVRPAA